MIGLPLLSHNSEVTRRAVDGLAGIASDIGMLYLGASVLDHSNILGLIGRRFSVRQ